MAGVAMNIDWLRRCAKALPHTTETVQWGSDLVFKVGGKMYAVAALEPGPMCLSLKCTPEEFAELTQRRHHAGALSGPSVLDRARARRRAPRGGDQATAEAIVRVGSGQAAEEGAGGAFLVIEGGFRL
jgi:hypothetical protein